MTTRGRACSTASPPRRFNAEATEECTLAVVMMFSYGVKPFGMKFSQNWR